MCLFVAQKWYSLDNVIFSINVDKEHIYILDYILLKVYRLKSYNKMTNLQQSFFFFL